MNHEVRWDLRFIAIVVATVLVMDALLEVSDFGARMSRLSNSVSWQVAPWVLLGLLFGGFLVVVRRYNSSD